MHPFWKQERSELNDTQQYFSLGILFTLQLERNLCESSDHLCQYRSDDFYPLAYLATFIVWDIYLKGMHAPT